MIPKNVARGKNTFTLREQVLMPSVFTANKIYSGRKYLNYRNYPKFNNFIMLYIISMLRLLTLP